METGAQVRSGDEYERGICLSCLLDICVHEPESPYKKSECPLRKYEDNQRREVLNLINRHKSITTKEISARLNIAQDSAKRIVKRLATAKLIKCKGYEWSVK